MNTTQKIVGTAALVLAASAASMPAVQAQTLTFNNAPAGSVAKVMSKRFGVTIVFRGSISTSQPVTFSVDNPDAPGGRLQAISNLASALDLDFQKVYVVSKVDPGAAVPPIPLDTNGPIVFNSTQVPVREAIQTVASVDNALTQISSAITGDVTLSSTSMNAADAAAAIAKQTGTEWKTYYGLFRRGSGPDRLGGIVLDRTSNGQPIRELPLLIYRSAASLPADLHSGSDFFGGTLVPFSPIPNVFTVPNPNSGFAPDAGFGGFGDPYGYTNPYGPYGYAPNSGIIGSPGMMTTPVLPPPPVTTTPPVTNGTTTVVPTYP